MIGWFFEGVVLLVCVVILCFIFLCVVIIFVICLLYVIGVIFDGIDKYFCVLLIVVLIF